MEIRIVPYSSGHDAKIGAIDEAALMAIRFNEDVYPESVHLALYGKKCLGYGYLACGTLNFGIFSLYCEFGVDSSHPRAIEAAEAVLEVLKADYERIRPTLPFEDVRLTMWAKPDSAVAAFLAEEGFMLGRTMGVFRNDLSQCEDAVITRPVRSEDGKIRQAVLMPWDVTLPEKMAAYHEANGLGFGYPDSEKGLLFRVKHWDAQVFSWTLDGKVLAAVTVWPLKDGGFATEDIFCVPAYRRQGLTESLLRHVLNEGKREGRAYARLNAFTQNAAALALYGKCGYRKEYDLTECYIE